MSQSLYAAAEDAENCQQIVEPRKASDILICIGDNLCLACIYKDANHPVTPDNHRCSCQKAVDHADHDHLPDALIDPVDLACTEVLATEGRTRIGERIIGRHRKLLDLHTRRKGRNNRRAECIDRTLQDNTSDCCDGKLQSHRDTHAKQKLHPVRGKLPLLPLQLQDHKAFFHIDDTADARNGLCNDRGDSCALYSHSKGQNTYQITDDINDSRDDKEQKRTFAVSEGAQDTSRQIIKHGKRDSDKDNNQIQICTV